MKKLGIFIGLCWTAFQASVYAQDLYRGGIGQGSALGLNTAHFFLNGLNAVPNYNGGPGRGNQVAQITAQRLDGSNTFPTYFGGVGNGHFKAATLETTLSGFITTLTFSGGSGRGNTVGATANALALNGASAVNLIFTGGAGRGDRSFHSAPLTLNGQISSNLNFSGGFGRGNTLATASEAFLSGSRNFLDGYRGGIGRGNIAFKTGSIRLNGQLVVSPGRIAVEPSFINFAIYANRNNWTAQWNLKNPDSPSKFELESSADGLDFQVLAEKNLAYQSLNGTTRLQGYFSNDPSKYFRLKESTEDGIQFYSDVIQLSKTQQINLLPNPVKTLAVLQSMDFLVEKLEIHSSSGKLVKSLIFNQPEKTLEIDFSDLAPGIYELVVQNQFKRESIRFSKQ